MPITRREELELAESGSVYDVDCPACGAMAYDPCARLGAGSLAGLPVGPHAARKQALAAVRQARRDRRRSD